MKIEAVSMRRRGLINPSGALTEVGMGVLTELVSALPPVHRGKYGDLFVPYMSKVVPWAIELVIIRDDDEAVLLTHRDDAFFTGWHTPGTYYGPGETRQEAVARCASREIKVPVR